MHRNGKESLTRLVCLLGKGSRPHQFHSAAVSKRPFEKLAWRGGWGEAVLCTWAHGKRGIPAQRSPALGDGSFFTLLCSRPDRLCWWTGMPWEHLSGAGQTTLLGVALWRRTVASLKACLYCVSIEFLCWSSKEVALRSSLRQGRASQAWWYRRHQEQRGRLHCHTTPQRIPGVHRLHCLGRAAQPQRRHRQLVQGSSSIIPSHSAHFSEEHWPSGLYFQGGKSWCQKRHSLRRPLHQWGCYSYHEFMWVLLRA